MNMYQKWAKLSKLIKCSYFYIIAILLTSINWIFPFLKEWHYVLIKKHCISFWGDTLFWKLPCICGTCLWLSLVCSFVFIVSFICVYQPYTTFCYIFFYVLQNRERNFMSLFENISENLLIKNKLDRHCSPTNKCIVS